jgi:hypothetical protein
MKNTCVSRPLVVVVVEVRCYDGGRGGRMHSLIVK